MGLEVESVTEVSESNLDVLGNTKLAESEVKNFSFRDLLDSVAPIPQVPLIHKGGGEVSILDIQRLHSWRLTHSFSTKVLDFNDVKVILEVVVDKEQGLTEEREFDRFYLEGYPVTHGAFFKLHIYRRPNAEMIQFIRGTQISEEEFPKVNFDKFADKSLFRKRAQ